MKNQKYQEIYNKIKEYDNIVIARHIRIDPDAMASQMGLKKSIELTFKGKEVYAIGTGTARFSYMGKLDKLPVFTSADKVLLIVTDTPDKKRVDMPELEKYDYAIKIDHHPFIEEFCNIELIDDTKSSASEMICDLIRETDLQINKEIAEILFTGMVSDTNRFLFNNATAKTFKTASDLINDYNIDITKCYSNLYSRPFSEIKLLGYMTANMQISENGVGCCKIEDKVINEYQIDTISSGDLINEFNHINELLVWLTAIEDKKNNIIRLSIRSRGPVINKTAEKYNGGGHKLASGARVKTFEEVDSLVKDLDQVCKEYIESGETNENN